MSLFQKSIDFIDAAIAECRKGKTVTFSAEHLETLREGLTLGASLPDVEKIAGEIAADCYDVLNIKPATELHIKQIAEAVLRRSLQPPLPQSWISVEDELPKPMVNVLWARLDDFEHNCTVDEISEDSHPEDYYTHWRHLPEPPPPAKEKAT